MNRLFRGFKIITLLLFCMQVNVSFSQGEEPATQPPAGGIPPGVDIPTLQQRVNELKKAGLNDQQIQNALILENQQSATPPGTSPVTNQNTNTEQQEAPKEEDTENEDAEDAEEEDKEDEPEDEDDKPLLPTEPQSRVFGHHIFIKGNNSFNSAGAKTTPPDDYIVGPGDVFTINVFGPSDLTESLTVAPDGTLSRQYMGKIAVAGLTFGRVRQMLEQRYRGIVSSRSTIEIGMDSNRRGINVNIVGEVRLPGAYRINASTPAFNALFEAGGINEIGSVRNISIKRNGVTIETFDLYDYLIYGNDSPIYLKDNDFIYVPIQGKVVDIVGPVLRSSEFELKKDEHLKDLLEFAGGLKYDAMRSDAQIGRLENEREMLIDFDLGKVLASPTEDYDLLNRDRVIIKTLRKGAYNIVQTYGGLRYPGTFQLFPGDRVSDLIERSGGLEPDAFLDRAYVIRIKPENNELLYIPIDLSSIFTGESSTNNIELQFFDALWIYRESQFRDNKFIRVRGRVRIQGKFLISPTMTLKDLLYLSGGLREDADLDNIELSYFREPEDIDEDFLAKESTLGAPIIEDDPETEDAPTEEDLEEGVEEPSRVKVRISISENWQNDPRLDTLRIFPFSTVRVYSKYEFLKTRSLEVQGAIRRPGSYLLRKGLTLKDLIYQAGGLLKGSEVGMVELYRYIDIDERGNYNTATPKREIIRVRIEEDWQNGTATDTILVEKYHKIVFRSKGEFFNPGSVSIKGLVKKPGDYPVLPNMSLRDLLYLAGGIRMEADFENIELSRVIETLDESGEIVPVPVVFKRVASIQDWQNDPVLDEVKVNSFDQVFVRKNPEFELQESVFIYGEIVTPGEYIKSRRDERLSSLVSRARGITEIAYLEGAYLDRPGVGQIAIKLEKALRKPGSKYDTPILEGDQLIIPPRLDVVTVEGNVLKPGTTVLFEPNKKRAKYYIKLAGGFNRRTKKKYTQVDYVDSRSKRAGRTFFFRRYPKVEQGAKITVAAKPEKKNKNNEDGTGTKREKRTIEEIIAPATAILTFYFLINRANN